MEFQKEFLKSIKSYLNTLMYIFNGNKSMYQVFVIFVQQMNEEWFKYNNEFSKIF